MKKSKQVHLHLESHRTIHEKSYGFPTEIDLIFWNMPTIIQIKILYFSVLITGYREFENKIILRIQKNEKI